MVFTNNYNRTSFKCLGSFVGNLLPSWGVLVFTYVLHVLLDARRCC